MKAQLRLFAPILLMALVAATAAQAQWPADPTENLALADRPDEQSVPHVVATSDGGGYVGWYDHASGQYDFYLQRLDPLGFEVWGHNGMLVSDHPQSTGVSDWHMIADSGDNAVLTFTDTRFKAYPTAHAYRIAPDGTMLWGPDGIRLSMTKPKEFCFAMRIAEASDGDFVFVWTQWTVGRAGSLMMQRVSPDGVARFEEGGITIVRESGKAPAFPDIVAAEDGSVIVSWLADNLLDTDVKFLLAQKFGADGGALWDLPVSVFDAYSLPVAYKPDILADGAGGAFLCWNYTPWMVYNAAIQHLDADGNELFPHNGVTVATDPDIYHYYPTLTHDVLSGEILVFFREYDSINGLNGIYGQRFSPDGERLWGDGGKVFVPLAAVDLSPADQHSGRGRRHGLLDGPARRNLGRDPCAGHEGRCRREHAVERRAGPALDPVGSEGGPAGGRRPVRHRDGGLGRQAKRRVDRQGHLRPERQRRWHAGQLIGKGDRADS